LNEDVLLPVSVIPYRNDHGKPNIKISTMGWFKFNLNLTNPSDEALKPSEQ
jgi:hypothetical protein